MFQTTFFNVKQCARSVSTTWCHQTDHQADRGQGLGAIDEGGRPSRFAAPSVAPRAQHGRRSAGRGFSTRPGTFNLTLHRHAQWSLTLPIDWLPNMFTFLRPLSSPISFHHSRPLISQETLAVQEKIRLTRLMRNMADQKMKDLAKKSTDVVTEKSNASRFQVRSKKGLANVRIRSVLFICLVCWTSQCVICPSYTL